MRPEQRPLNNNNASKQTLGYQYERNNNFDQSPSKYPYQIHNNSKIALDHLVQNPDVASQAHFVSGTYLCQIPFSSWTPIS